jgi:type I restriction enzyme S subunit
MDMSIDHRIPLSDFITLQRGFDLPTAQRKDGIVPVVASSGIAGYHNVAKVSGPGVVIGRSGSIGGGQFIASDFWPLNTTLWVKDFKGNNPRFIYYLLRSIDFTRFNSGAGVPTLNRNHITSLRIRRYGRPVQDRIVLVLSTYDDLIENNRRRILLLEQTARLLYKEWFVHLRFPGHEHVKIKDGVPAGWKKRKIADICETAGGGTPSTNVSEYWDGDITWIVPTDVTKNNCLVLLSSERKITEKGLRESSAKIVPANTILMTSRASVGFFALMDQEVCTNQGFINIIPHDDELRMYLLHNLISRVSEIRGNAKGSTYPEISKGRFREMDIVVPSKPLIEAFADFTENLIRQIRCIKKQNVGLEAARNMLLPRLMNGEIAV